MTDVHEEKLVKRAKVIALLGELSAKTLSNPNIPDAHLFPAVAVSIIEEFTNYPIAWDNNDLRRSPEELREARIVGYSMRKFHEVNDMVMKPKQSIEEFIEMQEHIFTTALRNGFHLYRDLDDSILRVMQEAME